MTTDFLKSLQAKKPFLELRGRLFSAIRTYFAQHHYLEIETPVLIDAPAPEAHIVSPAVLSGGYLRPSPELEMKVMLAAGYEKLYQMGSCFREGEYGRKHNPEFTLLEWYCAGQSDRDILKFTAKMLQFVSQQLPEISHYDFGNYEIISVQEAFLKYANVDAFQAIEEGSFDEILVTLVEPHLGRNKPTFLVDYPAKAAAFAQLNPNNPAVSERWELYLNGIELANAYGELIDPVIQLERFKENEIIRAENGFSPYPEATRFIEAIQHAIPPSAGCALGLDRLTMFFAQTDNIHLVRSF